MRTHILQPLFFILLCYQLQGRKRVYKGLFLEMAGVTRGRVAVVQKGSLFFFYQHCEEGANY